MKVTRFKKGATVRDVVEQLLKRPQDAVVVLSSDEEGNNFSNILDITEAHEFDDDRGRGIKQGTTVVILYPS